MSDIKRYVHKPEKMQKISRFYGPNGERQYVQAADFDAAQIELAALREELARVQKISDNYYALTVEANQRLADAERRNSETEDFIRKLIDEAGYDWLSSESVARMKAFLTKPEEAKS